jgi:hypothetical protein
VQTISAHGQGDPASWQDFLGLCASGCDFARLASLEHEAFTLDFRLNFRSRLRNAFLFHDLSCMMVFNQKNLMQAISFIGDRKTAAMPFK